MLAVVRDRYRTITITHTTVEEFVKFTEGKRAIKKVLIANNGIAAVKIIKSIRKFAYDTFGDARAIKFICMATPDDLKANAEYIRMADSVAEVPGGTPNNNYANVDLICDLAQRYEVDGVHPGWGYASEVPALPRSLAKVGVTFIGPGGDQMHALGDKVGSTIIAQSAGVPCIAWNGATIRHQYNVDEGIPEDVYQKANIKTAEQAEKEALKVGLPVMLKASWGGGGKGIRKVLKKEEIRTAFRQCQSEIPGSPIFCMKLAPKARHIEVQLLADVYVLYSVVITRILDSIFKYTHTGTATQSLCPHVIAPCNVVIKRLLRRVQR